MSRIRSTISQVTGQGLSALTWLVTAARANWKGAEPINKQRIYFSNHVSHGDFVLIWSVLPSHMRTNVRPVAGADYWLKGKTRPMLANDVFNAVLIDRNPETREQDPLETIIKALENNRDSIIIFPEGTRNLTEEALLPFKSGIYNLAMARPDIELVPVWIDNLNTVLPKGKFIPVPVLCTVNFGEPIFLQENEPRKAFLERAEKALLSLSQSETPQ